MVRVTAVLPLDFFSKFHAKKMYFHEKENKKKYKLTLNLLA